MKYINNTSDDDSDPTSTDGLEFITNVFVQSGYTDETSNYICIGGYSPYEIYSSMNSYFSYGDSTDMKDNDADKEVITYTIPAASDSTSHRYCLPGSKLEFASFTNETTYTVTLKKIES